LVPTKLVADPSPQVRSAAVIKTLSPLCPHRRRNFVGLDTSDRKFNVIEFVEDFTQSLKETFTRVRLRLRRCYRKGIATNRVAPGESTHRLGSSPADVPVVFWLSGDPRSSNAKSSQKGYCTYSRKYVNLCGAKSPRCHAGGPG